MHLIYPSLLPPRALLPFSNKISYCILQRETVSTFKSFHMQPFCRATKSGAKSLAHRTELLHYLPHSFLPSFHIVPVCTPSTLSAPSYFVFHVAHATYCIFNKSAACSSFALPPLPASQLLPLRRTSLTRITRIFINAAI